jgi:hypothetical protein
MKRIIFCILLFFFALKTFSQDKDYFSTEFDANYYYYFVGNNSSNNFNYGFSILISKYINKVKVSSGINYSTMSYYYDVTPITTPDYLRKREYSLKYLNFPIITNIEIFSNKLLSYSILLGGSFNKIIEYNIKSYYLYNETLNENIDIKNENIGVSIICGATISGLLSSKCKLNLSPFINYKVIPSNDSQRPNYRNIPDDGLLTVGFKLGIEYLFKTSDNK